MQPVNRLLIRNAFRFGAGVRTLVINPEPDLPWRDLLTGSADLRLFTQDFAAWRRLRATGAQVGFGAFPRAGAVPAETLVLVLPREKERLRMWLHWCAGALPDNGTLWLAGENRAGIKSAGRYLAERFGHHVKRDSARHCALFDARQPLADDRFRLEAYRRRWTAAVDGQDIRLCSLPGVFAHGKPDPGTLLLLASLEGLQARGKALDFGSGSGIIGVTLKGRFPDLALTLLDNSALALDAARQSLALNGVDAETIASDGFSEVRGTFELIVTNPPFHQKHRADVTLSTQLLNPVRNFLAPGGQLLLVANRHLPYRRWLDGLFGTHEVLRANPHFHVLRAVQC